MNWKHYRSGKGTTIDIVLNGVDVPINDLYDKAKRAHTTSVRGWASLPVRV